MQSMQKAETEMLPEIRELTLLRLRGKFDER